jgi:septal ring factor EnvC (AmiA/AmiB activator)
MELKIKHQSEMHQLKDDKMQEGLQHLKDSVKQTQEGLQQLKDDVKQTQEELQQLRDDVRRTQVENRNCVEDMKRLLGNQQYLYQRLQVCNTVPLVLLSLSSGLNSRNDGS